LSIENSPYFSLFNTVFQFLSTGCTFDVLEKLRLHAPMIAAKHHQALPALLAGILHEGLTAAVRTNYVKRSAASRANGVAFAHLPQAGRAGITEGAAAAAFRAQARIAVYELAAMHAGLFIKGHGLKPPVRDRTFVRPFFIYSGTWLWLYRK
jgi:hypothetical protein